MRSSKRPIKSRFNMKIYYFTFANKGKMIKISPNCESFKDKLPLIKLIGEKIPFRMAVWAKAKYAKFSCFLYSNIMKVLQHVFK
jgi:hypothetical protein